MPGALQTKLLAPVDQTQAKPFLKWAGGKRHLLAKIDPYLPSPERYSRYFEPFLGSGAMFFHLRSTSAFLSDRLYEVVNSFRVVRSNVTELIESLRSYEREHSERGKPFYYEVRNRNPKDLDRIDRAARFIYLNKTCYNGIYRVNTKGKFNVPIGLYTKPNIVDPETLLADNAALRNVTISHLDYSTTLGRVSKGDFVYLDPPYSGRFTSYHKNGFGPEQQNELSELFKILHRKKAYLLMSNGADESIVKLYKGFRLVKLESHVYLSGKLEGRKNVKELLVMNYEPRTGELLDKIPNAGS